MKNVSDKKSLNEVSGGECICDPKDKFPHGGNYLYNCTSTVTGEFYWVNTHCERAEAVSKLMLFNIPSDVGRVGD